MLKFLMQMTAVGLANIGVMAGFILLLARGHPAGYEFIIKFLPDVLGAAIFVTTFHNLLAKSLIDYDPIILSCLFGAIVNAVFIGCSFANHKYSEINWENFMGGVTCGNLLLLSEGLGLHYTDKLFKEEPIPAAQSARMRDSTYESKTQQKTYNYSQPRFDSGNRFFSSTRTAESTTEAKIDPSLLTCSDAQNLFSEKHNPFLLLGLNEKEAFNLKTLTNAYRTIAKKIHPDKKPGQERKLAEEKFKFLHMAYSVMKLGIEKPYLQESILSTFGQSVSKRMSY